MNTEIFNKNGSLKAKPPKRYVCKKCKQITSRPATLKTFGISIYVCHNCTGGIREREEYIEWTKRKSGQWDVEQEILELLTNKEMTRDEISSRMLNINDQLFARSFSDLCYWGKLNIIKEFDPIRYSAKEMSI